MFRNFGHVKTVTNANSQTAQILCQSQFRDAAVFVGRHLRATRYPPQRTRHFREYYIGEARSGVGPETNENLDPRLIQ